MTIEVLAPAKVNLGLEVIRKRDDGFHDIATVFQTISVFDRLELSRASFDAVDITNHVCRIESNLVLRALESSRQAGLNDHSWRVELSKRIPIAAGLGGASADAAGVLTALYGNIVPGDSRVATIALELGSDVPFLLHGGAALAHGRGEHLTGLPPLRSCWFVLASPAIELERKTARLYGALQPGDLSSGARIDRVAESLKGHRCPDSHDLSNAFERPLADLIPALPELVEAFRSAGAPFVALSGAGPTHYTLMPTLAEAIGIASAFVPRCPIPARIMIARPTAAGPLIQHKKTIESVGTL